MRQIIGLLPWTFVRATLAYGTESCTNIALTYRLACRLSMS